MMKFRHITFLILAGLILGCQSASKDDESQGSSDDLTLEENFSDDQKQKLLTGDDKVAAQTDRQATESIQDVPPVTGARTAYKSNVPEQLNQALQDAIKSQDADLIIKASTNILATHPDDLTALNALAMAHYRKTRYTMAKYFLNRAIKLAPQYSVLHSNYGLVLLAQGERRDAVQSMKRALSLNSKDVVANANLGSMYVKERDYLKALPFLETAYRNGNADIRILNNYGAALAATGKYQQAGDLYQRALDQDPGMKEAILNLAILQLIHLKKISEGRETLNRLKSMDPPSEWRNLIKDLEKRVQVGLE